MYGHPGVGIWEQLISGSLMLVCSYCITRCIFIFRRRVATNSKTYSDIENILRPLLAVVISDPRIRPAWSTAVNEQHVRTDDMHGLTKFILHNHHVLAEKRFFSTRADYQRFVDAANRLFPLRNKAHHKNSDVFITNAELEQCFTDALSMTSLLASRPRAPRQPPATMQQIWNLCSDPILRVCGWRVGRYNRAESSLKALKCQWNAEKALIPKQKAGSR